MTPSRNKPALTSPNESQPRSDARTLTVGISSTALFDLSVSNAIYQQEGLEAYRRYQISQEDNALEPGGGFFLVEKLLNINLNYKEDLNNINVYTSNIKKINNLYYSNGGRIMSIVSSDNTLYNSIHNCYNFIKNITYENIYFRKDIGIKCCLENNNKNIKKKIKILKFNNKKIVPDRYIDTIRLIILFAVLKYK